MEPHTSPPWIFVQEYHHIPLDKSSIPKTAFNSPFRKYEHVNVPFGLAQVPAYFQELMTVYSRIFPFAITYLDDIIIFIKNATGTPFPHLHGIRETLNQPTSQ